MRVAFVGVKRKYRELDPDYRDFFNQYHLELPWYFARDGGNTVILTTVDHDDVTEGRDSGVCFDGGGQLVMWDEGSFQREASAVGVDVVVHWRKWFPEFHVPGAVNVINCQDHSFSPQWKNDVLRAYAKKELHGILCFPGWHKSNIYREMDGNIDGDSLIDGLTLGVDTDIYFPAAGKDPHQMLWASDPGRGLAGAVQLAVQLFRLDSRFRLNVCYPDYCQNVVQINHPAIVWHGNVPNGPKLWDLFNRCGVLPYTSTFKEPSSRAHRQAQAAGSLVLYPPDMGTPSDLIENMETGVVAQTRDWSRIIMSAVATGTWRSIGTRARDMAVSENWATQAQRFNNYFEGVIGI